MDRSVLLVLCLVTLSNVQLGQSQCNVVRIAAAVYETLSPILNEVKEDISCMKSEIANLSETVSHLAEELEDHKNETASELVHLKSSVSSELANLGSSLQSMIDNPPTEAVRNAVLVTLLPYMNNMEDDIKTELGQLVRERSSAINETVVMMNSSMRDDHNCVKNELSRVNEIISDLGGHLQTHSQQTTSAVAHLDTRLSSLNESMKDDFSGVERGLNGLNSTANMICDKIKKLPVYTCGGTGWWRRAVYLDMTDPNTTCPSGWQLTGYSKRTCGRVSTGWRTCDSVFFPVIGGPYSQVCGKIRAYQRGLPDGFAGYNSDGETTIDSAYVSGVAVMHGRPRQHIWTFANGAREYETAPRTYNCPCDDTGGIISIPPFVGEAYFCESAYVWSGHDNYTAEYRLHSDDILWDGEGCHSTSTCCSLHNPPYFTKTLKQTTSDDLELRMCLIAPIYDDNIAVELVELYVK